MLTNNQTFILTVHNKEFLLLRVLESIKKFSSGNYELIIVLDGCTDRSAEIANQFKNVNPQIKIIIITTPDVFEVKANNAGLRIGTGEIAIIIQDDMIVNENNWNERITKPFRMFDDVFAVTARCAHNWEFNSNSKHIHSSTNNNYEWSDILKHVDHAERSNTPRNIFSIRQCVNRGPLAFNYSDIRSLGYFDELFAPSDMDDHDLCFRMQKALKKVVGCYWIDYISDIQWGGARITGSPASWWYESNQKNTRIVYERHKDKIANKIQLERNC